MSFLSELLAFIRQFKQNRLKQEKEDRELLSQALDILIELRPVVSDNGFSRNHPEITEPCNKLLSVANRVQKKGYRGLAVKLIEFARRPNKREKDELINLIQEIAEKIKSPLHDFHRRENERFEKAGEELKQIREKEDKARRKQK